MRKIHYRNIGFPKTGTNWIWVQLMQHPLVDCKLDHRYKEHKAKDINSYKRLYQNFDVSVNLDTHVFYDMYDKDYYARPENIHEHTTHITMILRNPYEVLNSMYNMERNRRDINFLGSKKDYTNLDSNIVKRYSDFKHVFDYWSVCKLTTKYMFYDDLTNDPKRFMYDICEHIGIKPFCNTSRGKAFPTDNKDPLVFDNIDTIDYINRGISVIEDKLGRDLSHWKQK